MFDSFTAMMSLETTNNSEKSETLKPFCFLFFAQACGRIFIQTHSTESRWVIGPENILFAGACVHRSAENFTDWGSEGVNCLTSSCAEAVTVHFPCLSFCSMCFKPPSKELAKLGIQWMQKLTASTENSELSKVNLLEVQ